MRFLKENLNKEILDKVENHFEHYYGGAGYILPNGNIISCFTDDENEFETANHANIEDYLNSIGLSDKKGGGSEGSPTMSELGAIRVNNEEGENNYIELPKIRPTNSALYSLQDGLDKNSRQYKYIVVTGPNFNNDVKYYYNEYLPDDIIKKIKRYYSAGILYESYYKINDKEFGDYNTEDIKKGISPDLPYSSEIFDRHTLGGYSEYREYLADPKYIVMTTPREYFEHAAKGFNSTFDKQVRQVESDKEVLQHLRDVIFIAKKKFPLPYISRSNGAKQEGRHRIYIFAELFGWDKSFPCLILP